MKGCACGGSRGAPVELGDLAVEELDVPDDVGRHDADAWVVFQEGGGLGAGGVGDQLREEGDEGVAGSEGRTAGGTKGLGG